MVARCIREGLVGGTTFTSDASLIQADANKQYSAPKERWDPALIDTEIAPRAVIEYLDVAKLWLARQPLTPTSGPADVQRRRLSRSVSAAVPARKAQTGVRRIAPAAVAAMAGRQAAWLRRDRMVISRSEDG